MTDNTPMGKDQDHRSNALGFVGIAVLIAMNILCITHHALPSWPWQAVAIVGTAAFAYINFANTVEENSPWKSYGGFLYAFAVVTIYWISFSSTLP